MKDPGSYANPINSSFQKFRTTSHPPRDRRRWQAGGTGVIGVYMGRDFSGAQRKAMAS